MTQPFRLPQGGLIDRAHLLHFTFDGAPMTGHPGDTLASALLASGQRIVARSLKYHRPRGFLAAGLEEPSALVTVDAGQGRIPNLKATEVQLGDGMVVTSQNSWPSLKHDLGAMIQLGGKGLSAGFYYKTFMWPRSAWYNWYERVIRAIAGHGRIDAGAERARHDKRQAFCDILVIGSGPAGLAAALTAAHGGATTIIVEADPLLGGSLLWDQGDIEGMPAREWAEDAAKDLSTLSNVTVMPRSLAFGHYDHGQVLVVQSGGEARSVSSVLWKICARRIILASGAIERPEVFPGNDRPGVMLASAVRTYLRRYGVAPGRRAVIAVADPEERRRTRLDLEAAGLRVMADLDNPSQILGTSGGLIHGELAAVRFRDADGRRHRVAADLLCVSAGWTPAAHLAAQMGGGLTWDQGANCLLPAGETGPMRPAGGARGALDLASCLADGKALAHRAMGELELHVPMVLPLAPVTPQKAAKPGLHGGKAFVDLQNDVTQADVQQAVREGYDDVELAKRYTTLGMGTDQGKTSWANGILTLAETLGRPASAIGHTTYRPPYSPVLIGTLIGAETGKTMTPTRRTPFHRVFSEAGCVFQTSDDWLYARYFPRTGEDMAAAIRREVLAVRRGLGCVDMSTLGKFEIRGPDAGRFVEQLYCNNLSTLKPGRLRYGLMLREDGLVFDDGTICCLAEDRYVLSATTARRASVWRHLQMHRQQRCTAMDLVLTDVSEHWAALAIAGPKARELLKALAPSFACDSADFPFAAIRIGTLGGDLPVRVLSVSFSGELSYELYVAAGHAEALWARVMQAGRERNICPYGLEALDVLRIEKGHLSVGTEIDGRRTPDDLGMAGLVSTKKDFLGRALLQRPALQAAGRAQFVGLRAVDGATPIPHGAHLSTEPLVAGAQPRLEGHLTASVVSPTLGHPIAIGFLHDGRARMGERLWAHSPLAGSSVQVEIGPACSYDPKGERLHV